MTAKDQFYKVCDNRVEYLGERCFRFNPHVEHVIQVCTNVGKETKRGRSSTLGVYLIHRVTFLTNYMSMGYITPITKKEYQKQFAKVVSMLEVK